MSTKAPEHGPEEVCYANGWDGYRPFLKCLCGWSIRDENWEAVGLEFDQHLASTKAPGRGDTKMVPVKCPIGGHLVFVWPNGRIVQHYGKDGRECPASYAMFDDLKHYYTDEESRQMQPYQERVVQEKKELDEKLAKLEDFIFRGQGKWFDVPEAERLRMTKQYCSMMDYSRILGERIAAFK